MFRGPLDTLAIERALRSAFPTALFLFWFTWVIWDWSSDLSFFAATAIGVLIYEFSLWASAAEQGSPQAPHTKKPTPFHAASEETTRPLKPSPGRRKESIPRVDAPSVEEPVEIAADLLPEEMAGDDDDFDWADEDLDDNKRLPFIEDVEPAPLPVKGGEVFESSRPRKEVRVRITPQARGAYDFDESAAVEVTVIAAGKQDAYDTLAELLLDDIAIPENSKLTAAEAGDWYRGTMIRMVILEVRQT